MIEPAGFDQMRAQCRLLVVSACAVADDGGEAVDKLGEMRCSWVSSLGVSAGAAARAQPVVDRLAETVIGIGAKAMRRPRRWHRPFS